MPDTSNAIFYKINNALSVNDTEMVLLLLSLIELDDSTTHNIAKCSIIKSNIKILEVLLNRIDKKHINSFELLHTAFDESANDDMANSSP